MWAIIICGGGGKTTLKNKYPDIFVEIDEFVWSSHNKLWHSQLEEMFSSGDQDAQNAIGKIYYEILSTNSHLIDSSKILLLHNKINITWINENPKLKTPYKILSSIKPCKTLHEHNIKNREIAHQNLSRLSWQLQDDEVTYYSSYDELANIISTILDLVNLPSISSKSNS
jgi:hypothetical protein